MFHTLITLAHTETLISNLKSPETGHCMVKVHSPFSPNLLLERTTFCGRQIQTNICKACELVCTCFSRHTKTLRALIPKHMKKSSSCFNYYLKWALLEKSALFFLCSSFLVDLKLLYLLTRDCMVSSTTKPWSKNVYIRKVLSFFYVVHSSVI